MRKLLFSFATILLTSTIMSAQTLIGHWPFSGNANDISGNGLNGTVHGATLTTDENGTANEAYLFNGSSDHIDIGSNTLLNLTSWTIQASVLVDTFNPSTCQGEFIVSRGTQSSNNFYFLGLSDNIYTNTCTQYTPDSTVFQGSPAGPGSNTMWNTTNFITLHHWYCVTTTYASDTLKLYLDGTLINSSYWAYDYSYGTPTPSLSFGYYNSGGTSYPFYFNGKIEEITIWSGALSQSSISGYCGKAHEGSWKTTGASQVSNANENFVVSPNPAMNTLNIQMPDKGKMIWNIINEVGQVVQSGNANGISNSIDISKLSSGLYFVRATAEDGSVQVAKFVKD